jgi:uncharacterized protein (DUF952 family)
MADLIWKVCRPAEWQALRSASAWLGSPDDIRDGFIHFSTTLQLEPTIARHFASAGDLVLLAVDPQVLGSQLKWEPSRNGELFPHLYGPLLQSAIQRVEYRAQSASAAHVS